MARKKVAEVKPAYESKDCGASAGKKVMSRPWTKEASK